MNFPLNRTDFKLYRGLTNPIQILIRDVDRVPVTFANGVVPVIDIIQRDTQQVIYTNQLTLVDAGQSLWTFSVAPTDIADWTIDDATYTITTQDALGNRAALFMDRGYGLVGQVEFLDGPYPPSIKAVAIPASAFLTRNNALYSGAIAGAAQVNNLSGLHTFALYATAFSGSVEVQALLDATPGLPDSQWLSVGTFSISNLTGVSNYNFEGNFYWVRFVVTTAAGTFTQILVRS